MKNSIHIFCLLTIWQISLFAQNTIYNDGKALYVHSSTTVYFDELHFINQTNGAAGTIDNQGTIHHERNWSNNSANVVFSTTAGTVHLDGPSAAQVLGGTNSTTFNNLTLNNTFTNFAFSQTLDISVAGLLTLTDGVYNVNGFNLLHTNTGLGAAGVSGGSAASYIRVDDGVGTYRKSFGSDHAFVYHVGGVDYSPMTFSMTAAAYAAAYVSMRVIESVHADFVADSPRLARQWVSTSSGLTTPSYNFSAGTYQTADFTGTESDLVSAFNDGSGWVRKDAVNTGANTLSGSGVSTFGIITAGNTVTLPVELVSFEAEKNENIVVLKWITASEINNSYFTIERSTDNVNFETVEVVFTKAENGNSVDVLYYSAIDGEPLDGISYYRLKQTDIDGNYFYTPSVSIDNRNTESKDVLIFPNPLSGEHFNVLISGEEAQNFNISVFDASGKQVYFDQFSLYQSGENVFSIKPEYKLAPGIYFVQVSGSQNNLAQRLIVK